MPTTRSRGSGSTTSPTPYPATLSGGMQQRLAIGQALAATPRILLLDEPFGALDPGTRLSMHDFLQDLRAETGMTVFMVTHDLAEGFKLGDRVLVFDKPRWDPTRSRRPTAPPSPTISMPATAASRSRPRPTLMEETHVLRPA